MKASDDNMFWRAAEVTVALAVLALPWCLGGAPWWTNQLLLALATVAFVLWGIGAQRHRRRWNWHPVLWVPVACMAVASAQLIPLPPVLLSKLAPAASELREFALVPLGIDAWRPISLDLPATARALARELSLAGLLFVALQLGRLEAVRRRLLSVVGIVGLSVVACGFAHLLFGEEKLMGWYQFSGNTPFISPFGNTNHLAAFLTLTATVALGLTLDAHTQDAKLGWAFSALAMGLGVFLSLSRGGIGAFVVTWGLVGGLMLARKLGGVRTAVPWLIIGATVMGAFLLAFEPLVERAQTLDSMSKFEKTKIDLWPSFARGGLASGPLGMGAGAFELGFGRFQDRQLHETFTHPENILLQWLTELGLPLAFALVLLSAWVGLIVWRGTQGLLLERVSLIAVAGVLLHDVFDFSLELNAVSVLAVICLGLVAGRSGQGQAITGMKAMWGVGAVAAGVAVVASWQGHWQHLDAEHELAAAVQKAQTETELKPLALKLIARHPSDYVLYAHMAAFSAQRGDAGNALAWVNRLLLLRPHDARAHVAAGNALLRMGQRSQALLEWKTSFELGDRSALKTALATAVQEHDFERVLIDERGFLTECRRLLLSKKDVLSASALLEAALSSPPGPVVLLEARQIQVATFAERGDTRGALALLEELPASEHQTVEFVLMRARLLGKLARDDEAMALLASRLNTDPGNLDVAFALADQLERQGRSVEARKVFERTRPFVSAPRPRLELLLREATSWEASLRWGKALELVQSAVRQEPERADLHYRLGSIHEAMGAYKSAVEAVREGKRVDSPEGAGAKDEWLMRLQAQAESVR